MKINWLNLISAYVLLVIVFKDSATIVLDVFSLVVAALLVFTGVKKEKKRATLKNNRRLRNV